MPTTWNRWIRQEYQVITADAWSEPTFENVRYFWLLQNGSSYGLSINRDDSLAYNMARAVWRARANAGALSRWSVESERRAGHSRFNELVNRARAIGLNVRHNRTLHGDVAWNVMRARWLESQLGDIAVEPVPVVPVLPAEISGAVDVSAEASSSALTINVLTFGIEIECIRPHELTPEALARLLIDAGVPTHAEHYNHSTRRHWKIVTDASVSDRNGVGCEIVSPVLRGEAGFEAVRKVCEVLTAHCRVNRTCGLHVHVGAAGRDIDFFRNLLVTYAAFEQTIDSFMAPSRRSNSNTYCRGVTVNQQMQRATNLYELRAAYGANRFRKLNLEAYWRHSTVEFRHHQGTTEAEKAIHWVRFCLKMCLKAVSVAVIPAHRSLDSLMTFIDADESERSYFARRQALLSPAFVEAA